MENQEFAKLLTLTPATLSDSSLSPELWVDRYTRLHKVQYQYKTNSVTEDGDPLESSLLLASMRLKAHSLGLTEVKRMLPDAFLVWRRNQARLFLSSIKDKFKFKQSERDLVADWVEATTGARNELDIAVVRHFISQVKKKLYGLEVDHHMMIVLFGASGGGKGRVPSLV